ETEMKVEESFDLKAPFFGYAHIEQWEKVMLPDSVRTIPQLEHYLEETTKMNPRPFFFKLSGEVEEANIHVVNLPKGTKVSSPQEAHQGQKNYKLHNRDRKSTRLNSSHVKISYAVFCLKKKKKNINTI